MPPKKSVAQSSRAAGAKRLAVTARGSLVPEGTTTKSTKLTRKARPAPEGATTKATTKSFPVVGIGASAGGLEAFTQLLKHLPADTNMAFVLVQHLDPTHESMLAQLLAKATRMPVHEVQTNMPVEANHVYVIPPNVNMTIEQQVLCLAPRTEARGQHMPIDAFLYSLAEDQKNNAIGIILSGTASDGTLGLRAIKAEGGLTFAQEEASAKYDGMPHSAIAAGVVDFVMPPERLAQELARLGHFPHLQLAQTLKTHTVLPENEEDFGKIFQLLRNATSVDFTHYKPTTIKRRIARRMLLLKIEQLTHYVRYLKENPTELHALYQDLLINVTGFFRDPEAFAILQKKIFPKLLKERRREKPIRLWVPGCSTGEEAYSLAICLLEYLGDKAANLPIQIFATDLSESAIEKARAGIYAESATAVLSPERLRRFFVKVEEGFQINKNLRAICVFARQDITKDPPFSKVDLISCRNVLIYLDAALQKKIMQNFHYALNPDGALMLGTSETIGGFADLFALVDKKQKIYTKKTSAQRMNLDFTLRPEVTEERRPSRQPVEMGADEFDLQREADRIVLSKFAPVGVLINENLDILQFRGHTGPYLESASGAASFNVVNMARPGLMLELRAAIQAAKRENMTIRKTGLPIKYNGNTVVIDLEVIPIKPSPLAKAPYFLILFANAHSPISPPAGKTRPKEKKTKFASRRSQDDQFRKLQEELTATRQYLEAIIEEREAANEELRSALEEIQSSNEELQSTNEELETAKEELQSTNEELTTVNEEVQNRNLELSLVNSDMLNLLANVGVPIVMLSSDGRIRRFTPRAEKLLNLIPSDIGRPFSDLQPNITIPNLPELIAEVTDHLVLKELELQNREGQWYDLQIRPYKTQDNRIEGVVMAFLEIDAVKRSFAQAQEAHEFARAIVETARESLLVLDGDLRVKMVNHTFYQTFQLTPEQTENKLIYELGDGQWDIPELRRLLEEILPAKTSINDFAMDAEFPLVGRKQLVLNARRVAQAENRTKLILLAMEEARTKFS